jgi:arsenate reductase
MEKMASDQFSALAHPQRLAVLRLLIRRHPDRVAAGELAEVLALKPSTLSAHLSGLMAADLVSQTRAGRSLRYGVRIESMRALVDFLLLDCCRGRPDLCGAVLSPLAPIARARTMPDRRHSVLFICSGNSARSIMAEALLRQLAGDRFMAFSAGTRPYSEINPFALELLQARGHDTAPLRAKHVSEFRGPDAPSLDFVFTVCDRAANEDCPAWPGQPVTAHWGLTDPVKAEGTPAERALAFHRTYGALRNRLAAFVALPLETLDRLSLQRAVDVLGREAAAENA